MGEKVISTCALGEEIFFGDSPTLLINMKMSDLKKGLMNGGVLEKKL
jgi:hypothetical protein